MLVEHGRLLGTSVAFASHGRTVRLQGTRYRSLATAVEDAGGARLLALRPQEAIDGNVAPYRQRIRYAALGSFALLVLVALMFAGPLLRMLGDFRRVASQAATDSLTGLANRRTLRRGARARMAPRPPDRRLARAGLARPRRLQAGERHPRSSRQATPFFARSARCSAPVCARSTSPARYGGEEFVVLVPESDLKGRDAAREAPAPRRLRGSDRAARRTPAQGDGELRRRSEGRTGHGRRARGRRRRGALRGEARRQEPGRRPEGPVEAAPRAAAAPRKQDACHNHGRCGSRRRWTTAAACGSRARSGAKRSAAKGDRIAQAQKIPLKFLENILLDLKHAGLVQSQRGAEGGYWLAKEPDRDRRSPR